jgi:hypothetical protein
VDQSGSGEPKFPNFFFDFPDFLFLEFQFLIQPLPLHHHLPRLDLQLLDLLDFGLYFLAF